MEGGTSLNCPSCNKIVNDDDSAVQCEIFCKNWFHCDCVSISSDEYEYMKLLAEKSKWACVTCDVRLSKVTDQFSDIDGFINLNITIKNLIAVVKDIVTDNLSLNDKFDKFILEKDRDATRVSSQPDVYKDNWRAKTSTHKSKNCNSRITVASIPLEDDVSVVGDDSQDLTCSRMDTLSLSNGESKHQSRLLYSDVSKSTKKLNADVVTDNKCHKEKKAGSVDSYTSRSQSEIADSEEWTSVARMKSRKRKPIIGTNNNIGGYNIKAVGKCEWIFVSRLAPEVSKDDLVNFLLGFDVKAECIELKAKYDSYRSFKVGVSSDLTSKLLSAGFWPSGTLVREFKPMRSKPAFFSRTFLAKKPVARTVP